MNFTHWKSFGNFSFLRWVALLATLVFIASGCGDDGDDDADSAPICETGQSGSECEPCPAGVFCAGGEHAAVACEQGTWDDDADPASACVAWTDCAVGEFVATPGSAVKVRACASFGPNGYSKRVKHETSL